MRGALLLLLLPLTATVLADERILDYDSKVLVRADGRIEVTETITVRAEGSRIRRGIYRDYPTRYRDRLGNEVEVAYEPVSVERDGRPEAFHTERRSNGVRTYFGSAERLLTPGEHTYIYRYRAGRMLGFFATRDELYWNVTGLGWEFPIDHASATVSFDFSLPPGSLGVEAFTGASGEHGRAWRASTEEGRAVIETTAPLGLHEGLTIVVDWPKGYVEQPGALAKTGWLLSDNVNLLAALAGLAGCLAYYLPVWRRHGRDPEEGVVVTRYEPPAGFSPASLRYVEKMRYDDTAMTAAVINLAVKGYLRIDESGGSRSLIRLPDAAGRPALAAGEKALLEALFEEGGTVVLENENHELLGKARAKHRTALRRDFANRYFVINRALNLPALAIAVLALLVAGNVGSGMTPVVAVVLVAMGAVIVVFVVLMRRPTARGRKLLDEVAGFRDYLEIAEKDDLNARTPPEMTPELFERYLPFALALGVEQQWSERFAAHLAGLHGKDAAQYHPAWYGGTWNSRDFRAATSAVTAGLGAAISSSARPPGSSSGSGGGGFSGGGGGGGGGGGW